MFLPFSEANDTKHATHQRIHDNRTFAKPSSKATLIERSFLIRGLQLQPTYMETTCSSSTTGYVTRAHAHACTRARARLPLQTHVHSPAPV